MTDVHLSLVVMEADVTGPAGVGVQLGGLGRKVKDVKVIPRVGESMDVFDTVEFARVMGDAMGGYPDAKIDDVTWSPDLDHVNVSLMLLIDKEFAPAPWNNNLVKAGWEDWFNRDE